jgi:hypothetical protein
MHRLQAERSLVVASARRRPPHWSYPSVDPSSLLADVLRFQSLLMQTESPEPSFYWGYFDTIYPQSTSSLLWDISNLSVCGALSRTIASKSS